ncbi:NADH pyrophosphatase [Photobacterium jeanii]|uniref:NAD-capped RNA hydrolase NudC n=1 Tax=Photobacterium jeanii TaxID=858640 RepID=A0A178KH96_9GAMM|nr:NAD(+) diphosphatase [Photobacterium jeanii]OAN16668.1 NADH pyrophosphatase [Photobacterium jeanii]PST87396.1 NAD(+) diphosphatase [Photobacterium jeanii]
MLNKQEIAYWCVVKNRKLYLEDGDLPLTSAEALGFCCEGARQIGEFDGYPVYWLEASEQLDEVRFFTQRDLLMIAPALFDLAGKACQLSHMVATQQYCSSCGDVCALAEQEVAMHCQGCGVRHYPRVSPCVIVAVRRDEHLLLAQHPRHKTGLYTVIAGFVEAGETLEQCVAREVKEETGIEVKNIRYIASQPWAFPSNLMMGFLADYQSGELKPDYTELSDAIWAGVDSLPKLAPKGTIARHLIELSLDLMTKAVEKP